MPENPFQQEKSEYACDTYDDVSCQALSTEKGWEPGDGESAGMASLCGCGVRNAQWNGLKPDIDRERKTMAFSAVQNVVIDDDTFSQGRASELSARKWGDGEMGWLDTLVEQGDVRV